MNDILLEIARQEDYHRNNKVRIERSGLGNNETRAKRIAMLNEALEHLRQAKLDVMRAAVKIDDYEKIK